MLRSFRKQTVLLLILSLVLSGLVIPAPHAYAASAITIDSPADGTTVGSGKLRLSGVYSSLYDIKLFINGSRQVDAITSDPDGDNEGTWYYDLDTSPFNGPVQVRARGLDITTRYGVWSQNVQITVNNKSASAPVVRIVSPAEGVSLSGVVPVRVAVQSDAAVNKVEVRVNGGAWQAAARDGDDYVWAWDTAGIGDKTSSIEARAYNEYGVKGASLTTYAKVGQGTNETLVVPSQDRAMWLWEAATYNILLNPGSREVLDAMAKDTETFGSDPVKVLYFAVGSFDGMDVMEDNPGLLRDFIAWAHERGYQVYACIAGGTSPPYMGAYREFHDTAIRHFEQVLNYNISSASEERFDGVNVDIEPYISPDFKDIYPSLQIQYLEMTEKMVERRNATGMNLPYGPAIPKWYDTSDQAKNITYNGQTKWLSEHVQDITDYISIMNYRDTADGSAGIIAGAQGEIEYANKIGKPNSVVIGVETLDIANSGDPETITFREEGRDVMEADLDKVYTAFGQDASFGGIAMHHYDSIRALPSNWGPDGVLWQPPADSEPPTAPSRNPVAKAADFQTITLTYGRSYDNTEVGSYIIYRSTQPDFTAGAGNAIGTARSLNFKDTGLLPSTTYYYKIAAVDVRGNIGPASGQAKATTAASALKPMVVSSMKVERSGTGASVTLQVADMTTKRPVSAEVEGRFTFAGGKYVKGTAAGGQITLTSEAIPAGYQVGFEPRRIVADGYYWAQAYDSPHISNVNPRVRLKELGLSEGSLSVPFMPEQAHYTAIVAEDVTSVKVNASAENGSAAVKVNGVPIQSSAASQAIPLSPGENAIVIQTVAPDATTDSYTLKVIRAVPVDNVFIASEDAYVFQNDPSKNYGTSPFLDVIDITNADGGGDRLAYLKFDLGAYTAPVDKVTLNVYSAHAVEKDIKIDLIGYPADDWKESTLTFNNRPLANPVQMGSVVVRDSGWYSIDVTSFVQSQMVPNGDRKVTVRFIINDIPKSSGALVQFHSRENETNPPYLLVNPSSDASLSKLTLSHGGLTPEFDPERFSYTSTVSDSVYGVIVTPAAAEAHAQVTVNGQPVGNGGPSPEIPLALGTNPPILVEVTAQNGNKALYEITIAKELSGNADLNSLSLIGAKLDQSFSPDLTEYTAAVTNSIASVKVEAASADPGARVSVNGAPLMPDGLSQELPLEQGENDVTVRVEAPNGNSKTYSLRISREAKPPVYSADLQELQIEGIELQPGFQPKVLSYSAEAGYEMSEAAVKAVPLDPQATVSINGMPVSGGETQTVALQTGLNRLEIKVASLDQTEQVYVINVTRQEDSDSGNGSPSPTPTPTPSPSVTPTPATPTPSPTSTPSSTSEPAVDNGTGNGASVSAGDDGVLIVPKPQRAKSEDGTVTDSISVDPASVSKALELAKTSGGERLIVSLASAGTDPADEWIVSIPAQSLKQLAEGKKELEMTGAGVHLRIPLESLQQLGDDPDAITFKIAPIPQGSSREQVLQRLSSSESVLAATGGLTDWISTPWRIETNMKDKRVVLRFPLPQEAWEADAAGSAKPKFAVYIEHSDGETVLKTGEIYSDGKGKPEGIEIEVTKFSTFTVVRLPEMKAGAYITGFEDGTFRPEKSVSRAELATMLDRLAAFRPASDKAAAAMKGAASAAEVLGAAVVTAAAAGKEADKAKVPGIQAPEAVTDQALASTPAVAAESFKDVEGHWAADSIARLADDGILEGYPGGGFLPEGAVTRAEMAVILGRWAGVQQGADKGSFHDAAGHWAEEAIAAEATKGWLQGYEDGSFRPDAPITRAEAVVLLNRVLKREPIKDAQSAVWLDVSSAHWAYGDIQAASR
ncbi:cadherin-like beta sandwich domain-containing protein [Paenibacillus contaminans]|uniref:Fibronectin type-III domain-containing protein n=1 Tax=Paenibacillus contaminans TaxID=450362 RepID=A0A329MLU1_9BACL|nr:cadherin-like beta sandwich domain-containing protein [Paenibacillus contaminans]RAV19683.1 hypothetical protein DQG23_19685 [Paenibacillus contaminans]